MERRAIPKKEKRMEMTKALTKKQSRTIKVHIEARG
jgi:hypothetical protein